MITTQCCPEWSILVENMFKCPRNFTMFHLIKYFGFVKVKFILLLEHLVFLKSVAVGGTEFAHISVFP